MKLRHQMLALLVSLHAILFASGCRVETVIQQGDLREWFISRLGWAVAVSVVLGAGAAKLLCRLPFKAPRLDCNDAARMRFMGWLLVLFLLVMPLVLWYDAWLVQPFGEGNELGAIAVLSVAILHWRMLGLMSGAALVFYLSVAVCTRYLFKHTCNCRYAFFPKLR